MRKNTYTSLLIPIHRNFQIKTYSALILSTFIRYVKSSTYTLSLEPKKEHEIEQDFLFVSFVFSGTWGSILYTISLYIVINNIPCVVFQIQGLARREWKSYHPKENKDFALAGTISTHTTYIYLNASIWTSP